MCAMILYIISICSDGKERRKRVQVFVEEKNDEKQ